MRYGGLNPGAFYLCATPLALFFFILYFDTGSHEVAEGLTREREREREREITRARMHAEVGREPGFYTVSFTHSCVVCVLTLWSI